MECARQRWVRRRYRWVSYSSLSRMREQDAGAGCGSRMREQDAGAGCGSRMREQDAGAGCGCEWRTADGEYSGPAGVPRRALGARTRPVLGSHSTRTRLSVGLRRRGLSVRSAMQIGEVAQVKRVGRLVVGAPLFVATTSRLLIDLNRS